MVPGLNSRMLLLAGLCLFLFGASHAKAQEVYLSDQHDFKLVEVVSGLEWPWGLDFLPNGDMLVTEKEEARLRLVKDAKLAPQFIGGLPNNIQSGGQGGLLDVVVHPDFETNQFIYLSYSGHDESGAGTEVIRGRLSGHTLEDVQVIFAVEPKTPGWLHYGSRLVFAADGTLFVTVGDRHSYREEAQNPQNHLGSVMRINDDGSVPPDNPFVGKEGHKPEIYSYGHRNVQGLALRPSNQVMWMHEHGPDGGDEVNILDKPGANYGWPAITYGIDYSGEIISEQTHAEGMEQPVVHWTPSIAPSGMAFYDGNEFPEWRDDIFLGALAGSHIRRLELDGDKVANQEVLLQDYSRIRDVVNGPDGYLYFIIDDPEGKILRLEPL